MKNGLVFSKEKLNYKSIRISAQSYLIPFYCKFGFKSQGEEYLEDNILHTAMVLKL